MQLLIGNNFIEAIQMQYIYVSPPKFSLNSWIFATFMPSFSHHNTAEWYICFLLEICIFAFNKIEIATICHSFFYASACKCLRHPFDSFCVMLASSFYRSLLLLTWNIATTSGMIAYLPSSFLLQFVLQCLQVKFQRSGQWCKFFQ